jgi:hypothetical protein
MAADLSNLKTYDSAATKDCMTYTNHTASRMKEDVYSQHYLGRAALEERKKFLAIEMQNVEVEFIKAEKEEREAAGLEDCCNRVKNFLPELKYLFSSIALCAVLKSDLVKAEEELAAVNKQSFQELEEKRKGLNQQLDLMKEDDKRLQQTSGSLKEKLTNCLSELDNLAKHHEEKEETIKSFGRDRPLIINECEAYAEKRFSEVSIADLTNTYE